MSVNSNLEPEIQGIFEGDYTIMEAVDIPTIDDVGLGNVGKELEMAMFFIDIHESTKMVDGFRRQTAAKMYKAFLKGVVRIVDAKGGQVLSFNGDGVLAGFSGKRKINNAVEAALGLSWFIEQTLRPKMQEYFDRNTELNDMVLDYGLGIEVGDVLIVRAGIRGEDNNDLVWVSNATNLSVKLAELGIWPHNLLISADVYGKLLDHNKVSATHGYAPLWEERTWNGLDGRTVYVSAWMRNV